MLDPNERHVVMTQAPATIRIATLDDAEALSELASETFTDTFGHLYPPDELAGHLRDGYAPSVIRSDLQKPRERWWIAELGGKAIGYAQAGPCKLPHADVRPEHGELRRLYVLPPYKGQGIARELMDAAMRWLEETFTGPLWLGVYSENFRAQRFYAKYGFEKVGEYEYPVGKIRDLEFILRRA